MTDDIVTRLRDVVCWCNDFDGVCDACQAANEIERLQRWKIEACSVLADWDAIHVSLGDRGELGQRKSAVVAAEIERLREQVRAAHNILGSETMIWVFHGSENWLESNLQHLRDPIHAYWEKYGNAFKEARRG